MQKIWLWGLLLGGFWPTLGMADIYTVQGVEATISSKSATAIPREKALDEAVKKGFSQLLRKLTPPTVWPRHAWLMSEISPEAALEKITIVQEETVPQYKVVADLTFKRNMVREILAKHGVPFSETESATLLLIPVYEIGAAQILWEETNPWRKVLQQNVLQKGILNFTLPAGDMTEVTRLTPQMAVLGAADVLNSMAKGYNAQATVVARAQVKQQGMYGTLVVQANWYLPDEHEKFAPVVIEQPLTAFGINEDVLAETAQKMYQKLESTWRQVGMVAADKPARLYARYSASSAKEINTFEKQLNSMAAIFQVAPKLISYAEQVYEVDYFGNITSLQEQLTNLGYQLTREGALWRVHKVEKLENFEPHPVFGSTLPTVSTMPVESPY
ncbi:MAG: DUF2066 domain-containing protein [Alphaproteobacteria bacterium]|nr:DUF2066 domain-containing protein [Alphaproteobacteria bacterium]